MGETRHRGVLASSECIDKLKRAKAEARNSDGKVWTYTDVSIKSGVDQRTVSRFFNRKTRVDETTAMAICQSLKVEFEQDANISEGEIDPPPTPTLTIPQIDWLTECKTLLEEHKQRLSSNPLQGLQPKNFDVYVPLGLVKREKKERPQVDRNLDPSPERGSDFYRVETTPIEHDEFLQAVIDRQPGEHVVILGEPGAGKTTLLTRVWESLLAQNSETPTIVAWIPLAALGDRSLEEYVEEFWLRQVCEKEDKPAYLASLTSLRQAGRLCLLLDGADEIGGNGLKKIEEYLLQSKWAKAIKSVVTCRLNLWDGSERNELKQNFEIFRTLDFQYTSPAGDEVEVFILKWFGDDPAAGKKLRLALDETGKERIKDLAQNPLRLTLLCNIWLRKLGLPDTQAGLYKQFVDYVYEWKSDTFPNAAKLRGRLDRSMGELAKYGINKPTLRFRLTATELRNQLDDDCNQALQDLGWLNCIGAEDTEKIYAFFHPTFQEYFAACSIDDWDYFLPRAHINQPVHCIGEENIGPTYRVFESEWRQPILLWFGRENIKLEFKEKFIEKLIDFREQKGEFYYYRSYCMAAICIGEFKLSKKWTTKIIEKVVQWIFQVNFFHSEEWREYSKSVEFLSRNTIIFCDHRYVVDTLLSYFEEIKFCKYSSCTGAEMISILKVVEVLAEFDAINQSIIDTIADTIFQFKEKIFLSNSEQLSTIESLAKIAVNCQKNGILFSSQSNINFDRSRLIKIIEALAKIMMTNHEVTAINSYQAMDCLPTIYRNLISKISVGDQVSVDALISVFASCESLGSKHDDIGREIFYVGNIVAKFIVGDQSQLNILIEVLAHFSDEKINSVIINFLGEIITGKQWRSMFDSLIFLHKKSVDSLITMLLEQKSLKSMSVDRLIFDQWIDILGEISHRDHAVIDTLILIAEQKKLSDISRVRAVRSLAKIAVDDRKAIHSLVKIINQHDSSNWLQCAVVNVLGGIAVGNKKAIDTLLPFLEINDLKINLDRQVKETLNKIMMTDREIGSESPAEVNRLFSAFTENCYYFHDGSQDYTFHPFSRTFDEASTRIRPRGYIDRNVPIARHLCKIAEGDQVLADSLRSFIINLDKEAVDDCFKNDEVYGFSIKAVVETSLRIGDRDVLSNLFSVCSWNLRTVLDIKIIESLYDITMKDRSAINELLLYVQKNRSHFDHLALKYNMRIEAVICKMLNRINREMMPLVIWDLKNSDDFDESFFKFDEFLFNCAQTLSYPEFHAAWHSPLSS